MVAYYHNGNGEADGSMPLMTIHAIFYNQARFARATFESMLAQTYRNVEVVVSDDCSQDGTAAVLMDVARSYRGPHRVVVNVNERNMGIGDHFALVTSLSHAEWQTSLGGDDVAEPDYLEKIHGYAERHPGVVAIGCAATTIDESDRVIGEAYGVDGPIAYHRYESGPFTWSLDPGAAVSAVLVTGCVATYSRRLLDAAPFPKGVMSEDAFLGLRAPLVGDVLFIPDRCVRQRVNSESIMRRGKHSKSRAERQRFRRRMSAITYTSIDPVLKEIPLLRPDADMRAFSGLKAAAAKGLLGSFAVPDAFGTNYGLYREALREVARSGFLPVLRDARARGLLWPTVKLIARGMFG